MMTRNKLGSSGAQSIGDALNNNSTLSKLKLKWNAICDIEFMLIVYSLKFNTTLTSLNLEAIHILDIGALVIFNCLEVNKTIMDMMLHGNLIGEVSAKTI